MEKCKLRSRCSGSSICKGPRGSESDKFLLFLIAFSAGLLGGSFFRFFLVPGPLRHPLGVHMDTFLYIYRRETFQHWPQLVSTNVKKSVEKWPGAPRPVGVFLQNMKIAKVCWDCAGVYASHVRPSRKLHILLMLPFIFLCFFQGTIFRCFLGRRGSRKGEGIDPCGDPFSTCGPTGGRRCPK